MQALVEFLMFLELTSHSFHSVSVTGGVGGKWVVSWGDEHLVRAACLTLHQDTCPLSFSHTRMSLSNRLAD